MSESIVVWSHRVLVCTNLRRAALVQGKVRVALLVEIGNELDESCLVVTEGL